MIGSARSAPCLRARNTNNRKILQLGVAGLLATTLLTAASIAQARITKFEINTRSPAFGGYSFPLVGQYEVITPNAVLWAGSFRQIPRTPLLRTN